MNSTLSLDITQDNFDNLTFESSIPVLVLFSASRCNVCKLLLPVLNEIAHDYKDKINVFLVNVDEQDSLVNRFRLKGIPTLLIFNNGEVKERITGFHPKKQLSDLINNILFKE